MPADPHDDAPDSPRPWWAVGDPAWKSPWRLEGEDEEITSLPPVTPPVAAAAPVPPPAPPVAVAAPLPLPSPAPEPEPEPFAPVVLPHEPARAPAASKAMGPQPRMPEPESDFEDEDEENEDEDEKGEDAAPILPRRDRRRGKRRKASRTSWSSLILISLAVLGLTFVAWLYQSDASSVEDEDLRIATPPDLTPLITSPGRLEVFLESLQPLPAEAARYPTPWDWETNLMARWLVDNGRALDNLKDLLEESDWHGRHASWHRSDLGSHRNWATAAVLKQVEAAYMHRRGENEAALAALVDLAEMARRLQDILAWPSFYFRAVETHRRAAEALAELLPRCEADETVMATVQTQFEACAPQDAHVRSNVLPAFYLHEKKLLLGPLSGQPLDTLPGGELRPRPRQLFFKTNETLGMMATTIRYLVRQIGQPGAASLSLRDVWGGVPGVEQVGYYQPNGAGVAYAADQLKPYLDVPARQQLARTRHALIVQLFAMRRFVLVEKGLPAQLSDLSPRYLREVPRDPFTGEPLHYDAARGLIFSVGSDLQAQGGRPDLPPLADPGEPTVRIGVRTAVAR